MQWAHFPRSSWYSNLHWIKRSKTEILFKFRKTTGYCISIFLFGNLKVSSLLLCISCGSSVDILSDLKRKLEWFAAKSDVQGWELVYLRLKRWELTGRMIQGSVSFSWTCSSGCLSLMCWKHATCIQMQVEYLNMNHCDIYQMINY